VRVHPLLIVALLSAGVPGQQSPRSQDPAAQSPTVTFRSEVDFVEVHAIVTDRRGAFVKDLTADDFEIFEDGRLQKPSAFALVDLPIEPPFVPVNGTVPLEPDVRATTRTFDGRIYVFVMDDLHTDARRSLSVRAAAKEFVRRYLGTNDLAAVVYTSGLQDFGQELTSSHRLLLAAIDRFQGQKLPSAGAEKLAIHLRETADAELLADGSLPLRSNEALQKAETVRDPQDPQRASNARRALSAVQDVATWLRDVQGRRKALLYFSEGIDYDVYQPFNLAPSASTIVADVQEAIAAAQRANVNVYGIDPRGLSQFGGLTDVTSTSDYPQLEYGSFRGALRELRLSQESLLSISDETGGLAVVNAGDVVGGMGRIVLDNSRYYLLGYTSDSTRWSRRFLKIDVRVKRPDVRVRARRGFLPPDPKAAARAARESGGAAASPALKAALSRPVPIGDLPFRVFAAPFRAAGPNGSVFLAIEIDGGSLKFEERDGRFNEKVEVSIVAADARARVQGEDRQEFDLRLQPQTYDRVRRTGIRLLSRLTVPPGRYQIHVGAYERSGGATGTVPYDLELPDYARVPFGLSGIVVTSSNANALATANEDPLLKDVLPAAPVASRTFSSSETLSLYTEAYDRATQRHSVTFVTTVHEATSGRKVFESSDRRDATSSDRMYGFRTDIPLKNLTPGNYVLGVEATSTLGPSARRDILFDVAP
jgi:VWFA-related protein